MTLDAYHFIPSYDTSHRTDHELDQFQSKSLSGGPNFDPENFGSKFWSEITRGVKTRGGPNFPEKYLKEFSITCWIWFENSILVHTIFCSKRTKIAMSNNLKVDQNCTLTRDLEQMCNFGKKKTLFLF